MVQALQMSKMCFRITSAPSTFSGCRYVVKRRTGIKATLIAVNDSSWLLPHLVFLGIHWQYQQSLSIFASSLWIVGNCIWYKGKPWRRLDCRLLLANLLRQLHLLPPQKTLSSIPICISFSGLVKSPTNYFIHSQKCSKIRRIFPVFQNRHLYILNYTMLVFFVSRLLFIVLTY